MSSDYIDKLARFAAGLQLADIPEPIIERAPSIAPLLEAMNGNDRGSNEQTNLG